ncbi:MAG: NAD(P)H-dependent oxidoreductase, partial [Chloroflexaceae bacterium]
TAVAHRISDPAPVLPSPNANLARRSPPRTALLLVGSPRTRKSTSYALGDYLMQQLSARGIQTETIHIYTSLSNPQKMQRLLDSINATDLTLLAFPLYVDSLPAPVILLLERIAAHRATRSVPGAGFAALANCGFPEVHHTANALAMCAEFARATGFDWQGSLALGGGEGLVHGTPLHELGGRAIPLRNALTLAAEALAQGQPIPLAAQQRISKPFIPAWLYRLLGGVGWRQQARRWGAQDILHRTPYQPGAFR